MPQPETYRFVYRHIWEIDDEGPTVSSLRAEAGRQLSALFGAMGVRPTARPRFAVSDDSMLVAEVPVLRLAGFAPTDDVDEEQVRRLIVAGHPDGRIAAELGYPRSAVEEIRARCESDAEQAGVVA